VRVLSTIGLDGNAFVADILADWDPGTITFVSGTASEFDLSLTGPAGYTAGGIYSIDSGTLPASVTLDEFGILSYDGTDTPASASIVFAYTEPGALPFLTLHSAATGTFPYMATIYPLEGVVPAGMSLSSPNDTTLRGSVLSAWPDGSAQVMVVAGRKAVTASGTTNILLRTATASGPALTTAAIASKFTTGIALNFGAGVQTLNTWTSPDRIWWANPEVICARYRLSCGLGVMEAIIDVHAFASNHAIVEVVIENGAVDCDLATVVEPGYQTYTNATVVVNGTTIATVSSPTAQMTAPNSRNSGGSVYYFGGHSPFRAWYCSAQIASGVVTAQGSSAQRAGPFGVEVTHDAQSLQAHPWFFKKVVPNNYTPQSRYVQAYDTYVPWALCRLRFPSVNQGGGDEEIGLITTVQTDYILNGDKYARRAVMETGLAPLSADFCWRHTDGSPPTREQAVGKSVTNGKWPNTPEAAANYVRWGGDVNYVNGSHLANIALVPFLCRPSPVYIELAQREYIWNHTNSGSIDGGRLFAQSRERAWMPRNMATAVFLTPDSGTWNTGAVSDATRKTGLRAGLATCLSYANTHLTQPWNTYKVIFDGTITVPEDNHPGTDRERFQHSTLMHHYIVWTWNSIANCKVLRDADQTMIESMTDQVCSFIVRWYTEATGYEWRAAPFKTTVGLDTGPEVVAQEATLPQEMFYIVTGTAPSAPGPWLVFLNGFNWQDTSKVYAQIVAGDGDYYPEHAWFSLCVAVERGLAGADTAWTKVYGNSGDGGITNFSAWAYGLGNASRNYLNRFPRNK